MQLKRIRCDSPILLVLIGLFVAPSFIREIFVPDFYELNIFALIGCFVIIAKRMDGTVLHYKKKMVIMIVTFLFVLTAFSELHAGRTLMGYLRVSGGLLVPIILMYYEPKQNIQETITFVIKVFKIVSVAIVIFGIMDSVFGHRLSAAYFYFVGDSTYLMLCMSKTQINRLFSYIGHPLYNSEVLLITFALNFIHSEYFLHTHKKDVLIIAITMVGIVLTASKTGIVLYLVLLCLLYIKNIRYMILGIFAIFIGYVQGFYDYLIQRFMNGSLTTGRDTVWYNLNSRGIDFFHFLWGNGSDSKYKYNDLVSYASAAFEYPFRLFALEFGILFCLLFMFIAFVYPLGLLMKKGGSAYLIIAFLAIVLQVNTYNGIGTYNDHMYMFALFTFVVLNTNKLYRKGAFRDALT